MTVYVDSARVRRGRGHFSHMAADSLGELHAFAARIGVRGCWFHSHPTHPHYDVNDAQRTLALEMGAHAVDSRTLLERSKGMSPSIVPR